MLAIGVTGHRPNRLAVPRRKLAMRVRRVLSGLARGAESASGSIGPVLNIVSPLAEGCDRIVAHEALALGQQLTATLPFPRKDYEATFSDAAATADFRGLLRAAQRRLDLCGSIARPELGFAAVGIMTLACADIVLTIWDGKAAAGRGGTTEVLQSALEWSIPIIWVHATEDRLPVLIARKRKSRAAPVLVKEARKAKIITTALLREMGRDLAK